MVLEIDGRVGEGGGSVLRTALALSHITQKPFRMHHIRSERKQPGLKAQHIAIIRAMQQATGAKCTDAFLGSLDLLFIPGADCKKIHVDARTAAPVSLILQTLLPIAIMHKKSTSFTISGGTDVAWSPTCAYIEQILFPLLDPYAELSFRVQRRGFFPKGGGEVTLRVSPHGSCRPLRLLTRGESRGSFGQLILTPEYEEEVERCKVLLSSLDVGMQICKSASSGASITLWIAYEHTNLGLCKLVDTTLADMVSDALREFAELETTPAIVDAHLADQLVIYVALFGGEIVTTELTEHTKANIAICELFLEKTFECTTTSFHMPMF